MFTLTGKISRIGDVEQITDKFCKRDLVIIIEKFYKEKDQSYPVLFQFTNDNCNLLDSMAVLDAMRMDMDVTVDFEVRGNIYKDRVFNNLYGLKVLVPSTQTTINTPKREIPKAYSAPVPPLPESSLPGFEDKGYDDLPF